MMNRPGRSAAPLTRRPGLPTAGLLGAGALLAGCATPRADPDAVRGVVEGCQRAMFERGDFAAYIAAFAPDCRSVQGRDDRAAATDVVYSCEQLRKSRQFRFDGFALPGVEVTFHESKVRMNSYVATLTHLAVIRAGDYVEEMRERYELRRDADAWRIAENRYWPQRVGADRFDRDRWEELDAAVARSREQGDLGAETAALWRSLRFPEMWESAKRWTAAEPRNPAAWLARGFGAAFTGEPEDSLQAFARARDLDPRVELPRYAAARLDKR